MSDMDFSISLQENNIEEILKEKDEAVRTALEACGLIMERYAKKLCPVDTGLLRNSITHAVSGVPISHAYHASYGSEKYKAKDGTMKRRNANSKGAGSVGYGVVSGIVGTEKDHVCYIGTNVEYAPYVELGTGKYATGGGGMKPRPYIRPAIENHMDQYKKIIEDAISSS